VLLWSIPVARCSRPYRGCLRATATRSSHSSMDRKRSPYIKSDPQVSAPDHQRRALDHVRCRAVLGKTRLLAGHDRPIYIILMSSNADQEHLVNALDSGADEFIRKASGRGGNSMHGLRSGERPCFACRREPHSVGNERSLDRSVSTAAHSSKKSAQSDLRRRRLPADRIAIMFDVDHFKTCQRHVWA